MGKRIVYDIDLIRDLVQSSKSFYEVEMSMGAKGGRAFDHIKKLIEDHQISTKHFETKVERFNRIFPEGLPNNPQPLSEILVKDSTYSRTHLKKRLYREGLKTRLCELCGQGEDWKGNHMSLILDHINGVYNDNRLENLRIVCPNCNATLDTHAGKNKGVKRAVKDFTIKNERPQKILWPSVGELTKLVWEKPLKGLAQDLGVSDNAIRKHCFLRDIPLPPQGWWLKSENKQ